MTNTDPVMEPIFAKMIPCPGVGILKMIPCSAARPGTEKNMSTPPPRSQFSPLLKYQNCNIIFFIAHACPSSDGETVINENAFPLCIRCA